MKERRTEKRASISVFLRVFEKGTGKLIGHLIDINTHGFKLSTDSPPQIQQEYSLYMDLSLIMNFEQRVIFDAYCVWWQKEENSDTYICGMELRNITQNDIKIIRKLIKQFSG